MTFNENAGFWVFNQVTNFAYTRTRLLLDELQNKQKELEDTFISYTRTVIDTHAASLYRKNPKKAIKYLTEYSVNAGNNTVASWKDFYRFLFVKYLDGNVKEKRPVPKGYKYYAPSVSQPGYGDEWYRIIVKHAGDKLRAE